MTNWLRWLLWIAVTTLIVIMPRATSNGAGECDGDLLVYKIGSYQHTTYFLYDAQTGVHRPFFTDYSANSTFRVSAEGRLAFASWQADKYTLYVMDTVCADSSAITNITQNSSTSDYPAAWSPDGRYLAYKSYEIGYQLYVWDGETAINITPQGVDSIGQVAWSPDGKLAFVAWYESRDTGGGAKGPNGIFLWDGSTTTNLSQRPTAESRFPIWNDKGELAFYTEEDGVFEILIWDGVSMKNGGPDRDTFTTITTDIALPYNNLSWTGAGAVAFAGRRLHDETTQIYVWDKEAITNISPLPDVDSFAPRWGSGGLWSFVTLPGYVTYVHDAAGKMVFTTATYSAAWGPNNYLTFCNWERDPGSFVLRFWDGQDVIDIVREEPIFAQWLGGTLIVCSAG